MADDNLIVGFLKIRNELIRENNLVRVLHNMEEYCNSIYAVDDASWDGSLEYLREHLPDENIIVVPPEKHDFANELYWKQELLNRIHRDGPWEFILWMDADEVLDDAGTKNIRNFCREHLKTWFDAWSFHYTQLWRNSTWARTDDGFDDGYFFKLWRYHPDLAFNLQPGTHHPQFPIQVAKALASGRVMQAPFDVIHYGNYGTNLKWKCVQYYGGLGGVGRHMNFENASYRKVDTTIYPTGAEFSQKEELLPEPYTEDQKTKILNMKDLKDLKDTFCVTISSYNRAHTLERAIDSVLNQTYKDFILVVVDDGSTDNTAEIMRRYQEKDPRVFYIQFFEHKGGVAINEVACDIAVNTCEYWVRLGSDDWLEANKLELDKKAFDAGHSAIFGTFQAFNQVTAQYEEKGNFPFPKDKQVECFEKGGFIASWADFAVKTSILKIIKNKHGEYVHKDLMNMEDALLNYRIAKISPWVWRGIIDGELVIDPSNMEEVYKKQEVIKPTAYWNKDPKGSSANGPVYAKDRTLTTQIISQEKNVAYGS